MTRRSWPAVVVLAMALGACDDDPSRPDDPDLTRADVAGVYDMTELSFDPQGSLPSVNLLARVSAAQVPELIVAADEDSLQLVFRLEGSLLRVVRGSYDLGDDGISVELANATEPAEILIPRDLAYAFDEQAETLRFSGTISADTTRLFTLVPEWSGEPVTNPLPGTLSVTFTRN